MPAHPLLIAKLKEVLSDHMKSLPGVPAELKDYVVWGKMFIGYLNHLEMLDGFVLDADITKWVEEVTAAKAKEEECLTYCKVHEAEKLALLMADKISPDDFEWNLDDDLMLLDLVSLGEFDANTEMTVLTSETRGDVSAASDVEKGKGHAEKCKTAEVSVSDPVVTTKQPKSATHDLKVIPEGAILVNNTCYHCVNEFHFMYACYQLLGMDRCTKCTQDKKRCSLSTEAARSTIPMIKVELAKKKDSSSSTPHPKPTARSFRSSTMTTAVFLKKSMVKRKKLMSEVVASVEPSMSLPGLINAEDMITWHMESNACKLAIILAEHEANKHKLEKVRRKICIAKRALGMKEDE
ncbi:hypothetical protein EW146_g899 [Bondarzewia mesenterica]|uniref:Uncharacterized protein n=1 Tax=Bondarzewia mesenterica TaxID=1095465 RepID=A0A4S4M5Y8_9AGAM|nr:hypothetical protein EW146_g899 [Bondarzewia mesenterica]